MLLSDLVTCSGTHSSRIELASEQIHQQAVAPCPLRRTPVLAHDADRAEADLFVRPDGRGVDGRRVISFHRTSSFALPQPSVVPLILGRAAPGFRPYVHLAILLPRRPTARQSSSIYSSPCPPCRRRRRTLRRHSRCGTLRDPDNVGPDDPGHS